MINKVTVNCTCLIAVESYENIERLVPPTRVCTYMHTYTNSIVCIFDISYDNVPSVFQTFRLVMKK